MEKNEHIFYHKNELGEIHREDDLPAVESKHSQIWYKHNLIHRDGDKPALIDKGLQAWFQHGLLHREQDFPAQIIRDGEIQIWFKEGKKHRVGGPACIEKPHSFYIGNEQWWFEDKKHREDGPAVIFDNGDKEYWIHGTEYTEEEFHHEIAKRILNESLKQSMQHKKTISKTKI